MIRFGDICGYDDAEVITLDDNSTLVIDLDERSDGTNEDGQQDL